MDTDLRNIEEEEAKTVRKFIENGELDAALCYLANCIVAASIRPGADKSIYHYYFGNVYRKKGEFGMAMEYYARAIEINPESPAVEARKALKGIMDFYNKDMYNH